LLHYPEKNWGVITGPPGILFSADSQGFHKGGHVAAQRRAIFQINVVADGFGVFEPPISPFSDAPNDLRPVLSAAPRCFSRLFTPLHLEP
jgi:hypothetical protein